jgi:hypothetical protein
MSSLLVALVPLLATVACSGVTNPNQGNVHVRLSASDQSALAPSLSGDGDHQGGRILDQLETANVTFSSLLARNADGQLVDLGVELPKTVDAVGLLGGAGVTLPAGSLPPGTYDQLVVVMTQLELAFVNGAKVALTPPGGGWTTVVPVTPFTVIEGQELTIELNLHLGSAFREASGAVGFFPEFEGHHH